jgi:hypothetical protein
MTRLLLRLTLAGMVIAVGFGLVGHTSAQQGQKWVVRLDRLRARSLSDRQSVGSARSTVRVSVRADRGQ